MNATETLRAYSYADLFDWINGRKVEGLPNQPDRYIPGHIKWGSNPNRGRALQRSREAKKIAANCAALRELLPCIRFETPRDALDVALMLEDTALAVSFGWQRWGKDNRASWIHESESEKLAMVAEMHATRIH